MAIICSCDELGIPNTGFDCFLDPAVATGIWLVPYFDSDGNVYTIDCADSPFDKTYFDGLVNETDKSKRLYPLPAVDNVEDVRADSVVFTTSGGVNKVVRAGTRTFTGLLFDSPAFLINSLESVGCTDFGVYFIDLNGNIIGNSKFEADKLAPFRIQKGTIDPTYIKSTDDQPSSIQFKFDFDRNELSSAGFTIATTTDYGDVCSPGSLKGAVVGDWSLLNGVTPVTLDGVVESPAGTYTFDFTKFKKHYKEKITGEQIDSAWKVIRSSK